MKKEISMKTNRYLYLILGTLTLLIAGLMYNFTVFNQPIMDELGCSQSQISLAFSLCQVNLCTGGLILGLFYNKIRFKPSMIISSILLTLGLLLSSFSTSIWHIYLFYSIMMNLAAGFLYKGVNATVLPWFSEKPGLANGVMMLGAGLTAFVFNVPTTKLISLIGWRNSMRVLALIAFFISFIVALTVKPYSGNKTLSKVSHAERDYTAPEMLKTALFHLFFVWSVLMLAGCTAVTGNAVGIAQSIGMNASNAALMSMIISLFNSIGRVVYGIIYDKKGLRLSMMIVVVSFFIGVTTLQFAFTDNSILFIVISFVGIGIAFGGVPTISSTYILNTFGSKYYAINYSIQGMFSLFSSLAGTTLFSLLYGKTNDYSTSYLFLIGYAIIAFVLCYVLNRIIDSKRESGVLVHNT